MNCKICNSNTHKIFTAVILEKYTISYFLCSKCGFLFTEYPYWLGEAYSESIARTDTGIISRNIIQSNTTAEILYLLDIQDGKSLDYGGGYGILTRLMRDLGYDFYWYDKYTKNIFAKEFEYNKDIKIDTVTAFEVFEHFINPLNEIEKLLSLCSTLIFSTELYKEPCPAPNEWWYYGLNTGQHISFYSKKTIQFIASKYKLNYYEYSNIHILTTKSFCKRRLYILKILNKIVLIQRIIFSKIKYTLPCRTILDYKNIIKKKIE